MRTLVTFRSSAFRTDMPPGECGEDVARWMLDRFRSEGATAPGDPLREDYGWVVTFAPDRTPHWVILGLRPGDEGEDGGDWVCSVEKKHGLFKALLGRRARAPEDEAVRLLHRVLSDADQIEEVQWHVEADFQAGREEDGADRP